ncbi:SWIM zinc finger family protein [Aliterella atlantica]|uniref:SWIM Zn-finger protein n=1 Tax=Aliterella atlantica CENA595 TaxID=1618023 RepID=A0A0D8ZUA6_9CYAN|nr:SWIM zinc finger family protein [Aliterella atlantica]KJH71977.1 SWIM Zn-finger protein [Aliterella atlantica CENA595]
MTNYNAQASREWWAQRWLDLLDSYRFKKRLERARNYSRQGNVLSIKFEGAKVLAAVQGTEIEPYKVTLSLEPFTDEQWGYVIETMAQRAVFAAKLLAGEMPQNIEEVFTANGLSLFPFTLADIRSKCSCPDKANPCKHVGAVYYQLGDRFSEDPFVLFQLRGSSKEQIIAALRQLRSANITTDAANTDNTEDTFVTADKTNIEQFWQYERPLDPSLVVIAPSPGGESILDILGPIPLSIDGTENSNFNSTVSEAVIKYLDNALTQVSQKAALFAMSLEANRSV